MWTAAAGNPSGEPVGSVRGSNRLSVGKKERAPNEGPFLSALEKNDWIQTRAAEQLGISEGVLRYKMQKNRIRRPGS